MDPYCICCDPVIEVEEPPSRKQASNGDSRPTARPPDEQNPRTLRRLVLRKKHFFSMPGYDYFLVHNCFLSEIGTGNQLSFRFLD